MDLMRPAFSLGRLLPLPLPFMNDAIEIFLLYKIAPGVEWRVLKLRLEPFCRAETTSHGT